MKGGETNEILTNIYNSLFVDVTNNNIILCLLSLFLTICVIIYSVAILYAANSDNNLDTMSSQYTYIGLIIVPIIIAFFFILQVFTNNLIAYNTITLLSILGCSSVIIFL